MPDVDFISLDESATIDDGLFDVVTQDYKYAWDHFLPKGFAWVKKATGLMQGLFCALAYEPSRVEQRGRDLLEEFDPRTTQELLEDWERVLGLPGGCENPPETEDGRRQAVLAKLTQRAFSSRTFFLELAATLGYPAATITTSHMPFICGSSVCGDPLQGHHGSWTYAWTLTTNGSNENDSLLQCLVREAAQAHVIVYFQFPGEALITALPGA